MCCIIFLVSFYLMVNAINGCVWNFEKQNIVLKFISTVLYQFFLKGPK